MRTLVAALLAVLTACGGGRGAREGTPANTNAASSPASQVEIRGFLFRPETLRIERDTFVTWINRDDIAHTVTAGTPDAPLASFDHRLESAGDAARVEFSGPGTFLYFCSRHEHMRGSVEVT